MTFAPRLYIFCPPQIAFDWNFPNSPIAKYFDGNNISIRGDRNIYTRVFEGNSSAYIDAFSSTLVDRRPRRIGFSLKILDGNDELYLALLDVIRLSLSPNTLRYTPITVYDYFRPDRKADYLRGYAIRSGMLSIDDIGGVNRRGSLNCVNGNAIEQPQLGGHNGGFTLKFSSVNKEII
jgi:hypothetical protein